MPHLENKMTMETTENSELDKLLQEVQRTIMENSTFLKSLKQESLAEEDEVDNDVTDAVDEESFEEL